MPMSYDEWCAYMERRYDTMPTWYWSARERMDVYQAYWRAETARRAPGEQAEGAQGQDQADTSQPQAQRET